MFSALLDTSVLWPSLQRDFLLSMAVEGLYRPLWSDAILEELQEHETLKLVKRGVPWPDAERRAHHLMEQMRRAFDDALVSGWEPLDGSFSLPDPKDEHVVAAAVIGSAGVIVTDNLKHFPRAKLPEHIDVQTGRDSASWLAVRPQDGHGSRMLPQPALFTGWRRKRSISQSVHVIAHTRCKVWAARLPQVERQIRVLLLAEPVLELLLRHRANSLWH